MAAALRRLRALGRRRRRPLSLTERSGAGTRGAMAGGRRGAIARPEQSSRYSAGLPLPRPRSLLIAGPCLPQCRCSRPRAARTPPLPPDAPRGPGFGGRPWSMPSECRLVGAGTGEDCRKAAGRRRRMSSLEWASRSRGSKCRETSPGLQPLKKGYFSRK